MIGSFVYFHSMVEVYSTLFNFPKWQDLLCSLHYAPSIKSLTNSQLKIDDLQHGKYCYHQNVSIFTHVTHIHYRLFFVVWKIFNNEAYGKCF